MAMMLAGSRRSFQRRPARGRSVRRGPRRIMRWDANIFANVTVPAGTLTEFNLLTQSQLATTSLGRGTVGMIYGRITVGFLESVVQNSTATFAWGIRLKEADAVAVAGTTFSPTGDADSSDWMTWRAGSLIKTSGAGATSGGEPLASFSEPFVIRNPRKIDQEDEFVMLFETLASSTAGVQVCFWCRAAILLP